MKALKVKDLYEIVKHEIEKGNGNKTIMISNDDEGNGYHYLWYAFTDSETMKDDDTFMWSVDEKNVDTIENTIVLG